METIHYASAEKPWMKFYPDIMAEEDLPKCTMYQQIKLRCQARKCEDEIALYYYGTELSYREMFAWIDQYTAAFAAIGVSKGERVSIVSVSLPESLCALYALNRLGAVCNLIDPRTDAIHTREYIKKARSRVLLTLEGNYEQVADVLDDLGLAYVICQNPADSLPGLKRVLYQMKNKITPPVPYDGKRVLRNSELFALGAGKTAVEAGYEPDMPAVIVRTGGTTGLSKGVVLTNENMNALAASFFATITEDHGNESFLNFLPLAVSYGVAVGVHMALTMGIRDILIPKFDPDQLDRLILRYKPQHIIGVPVFYEKLIYSLRMRGKDLSFISTMAAGGDSASGALEDKLDEFRLAHGIEYPIAQGYGMSEVSSAASFGFQNVHRRGSTGIPCCYTTIAAFAPGTEEELPIGTVGEIYISGPTVMKEYLAEPQETAAVRCTHKDGTVWIHSGDLGYVDEDGFVFIVGRIKRSIIRFDGHKVYPLQIENVVMQHNAVRNCAVVPIRDRNHMQGEWPLICVETDGDGYDRKELTEQLLSLCRQQLEKRSQPMGVVFIDAIPLTKSAKNDVKTLTERYYQYDYTAK